MSLSNLLKTLSLLLCILSRTKMGRLNGDDLGALGELKFAELCAKTGLIFNKSSDRDRAGWDFIVNLDFDESSNTSLDKRRGPSSCVVQVKATSQSTGSVRLALGMADRLAKDLNPCFVCVLKADMNFEFTDIYLVHITGHRLAAILRRLREESRKAIDDDHLASDNGGPDWRSATQKPRLNRLSISFTPTPEERIPVSGAALRAALEAACGKDVNLYSSNKEKQLLELGYEGSPIQVVTKLDAIKRSELEEAFLGLRESVSVSEMSATEIRFDIELPEFSSFGGKLSIRPSAVDTCQMTFRAPGLRPASFAGEVFVLPRGLARGHGRFRVRGPFAEVVVVPEDRQFTMAALEPEGAAAIADWSSFFTVCQVMHLKGDIEFEPSGGGRPQRISLSRINYEIPPPAENELALCDALANVMKQAGINHQHEFSWPEVIRANGDIFYLAQFLSGNVAPIVERVPSTLITDSDGSPDSLDSVFMRVFVVGDIEIGYYVKADIRLNAIDNETFEVRFENWRLMDTRRLAGAGAVDRYRGYVKSIEGKNAGNLCIRTPTAIDE